MTNGISSGSVPAISRRCVLAVVAVGLSGLGFTVTHSAELDPKLVITGASGHLGGQVLDFLVQKGVKPSNLILVSRSPEKLASWAQKGAQVRHGDFDEPSDLAQAFAGGQRMLLISSGELGPKLYIENQAAIDAAKKAGIQRIVYTSFVNAQKLGEVEGVLPSHYKTEVALRNSGMKWIILRNQDYMENTTGQARRIVDSGIFRTSVGDGKVASVAHEDCAEAAAAALLTAGPVDKLYEITGPQLLGAKDVVRILSEVSGKPIRLEQESPHPAPAQTSTTGTPAAVPANVPSGPGPSPEQLAFFEGLGKAQRDGYMAIHTDDFQQLTGHAPKSLHDVLMAQRAALTSPPSGAP